MNRTMAEGTGFSLEDNDFRNLIQLPGDFSILTYTVTFGLYSVFGKETNIIDERDITRKGI